MNETIIENEAKTTKAIDKESMPILLITMTIACIIGAAGLSITFNTTKETISETIQKQQSETIKKVLPQFDGIINEKNIIVGDHAVTFFVAQENNKVIGVATISSEAGYGGPLKVMVGILPDSSIYGVELLQHQETPGLGAKAGNDDFKSQFVGKKSSSPNESLAVIKTGEKSSTPERAINAITAATITSEAFTKAVNKALISFQANKQKLITP